MRWNIAVLLWLTMAGNSAAVLIDSFDEGAISRGPETADLDLTQTGLPSDSVLGSQREWIVLYGGSIDVDASSNGELQLNHDRGFFEVAILAYGPRGNGSSIAPLDADLTEDGHTQFTLRIKRSHAAETDAGVIPAHIQLTVRSGVEGTNSVGASLAVRPIVSQDAYVLQAPFNSFSGFQGPVDFTDIDMIDVSFFFGGHASLTMDEIATSAGLPGDYNMNGVVDAADYSTWRNLFGKQAQLPNENPLAQTPGVVDDEDFAFWKSQFGQTFPASPGVLAAGVPVPEASAWSYLVAIVAVGLWWTRL